MPEQYIARNRPLSKPSVSWIHKDCHLFSDTSFVNNNGLIAGYGSSIIEVINRFYWREERGEESGQEVICQEVSGFKLTGAR